MVDIPISHQLLADEMPLHALHRSKMKDPWFPKDHRKEKGMDNSRMQNVWLLVVRATQTTILYVADIDYSPRFVNY